MEILSEIDIEFSSRVDPKFALMDMDEILHYKGYRPSQEEFSGILSGKYFLDKVNPPEVLIQKSYYSLENNPDLDNRVKAFMFENNLTLCETFFPNLFGGFTYIVNYSFDDYKTFGLIAIDSSAETFQF
jgi:hypothetical protein